MKYTYSWSKVSASMLLAKGRYYAVPTHSVVAEWEPLRIPEVALEEDKKVSSSITMGLPMDGAIGKQILPTPVTSEQLVMGQAQLEESCSEPPSLTNAQSDQALSGQVLTVAEEQTRAEQVGQEQAVAKSTSLETTSPKERVSEQIEINTSCEEKENSSSSLVVEGLSSSEASQIHCAVEAFARFARTELLEEVMEGKNFHEDITYLLHSLIDFSDAIHLCKADDMEFSLNSIRKALSLCDVVVPKSEEEKILLSYLPSLRTGLEYMLEEYPTSQDLQLSIIEWALKVGLYQQAVTLATEWLPTVLFNKKIYYTDRTNMEEIFHEEMEAMQRTWKECFVITYRDYAGNTSVSAGEEVSPGSELSRVRDILRTAIGKKDIAVAFKNFAYNKEKIVPFLESLYDAYIFLNHNMRTPVDRLYFQEKYPEVDELLYESYNRINRSETYHKQYYQYLQQISSTYANFLRPFLDQKIDVLEKRYEFYRGVAPSDSHEGSTKDDLKVARVKLLRDYQAMLTYGSAKTNCSQIESLQFMVEYHYIRFLRNHINHAADKTLIITKQMVKDTLTVLIASLKAGEWLGTYTVEEELSRAKRSK